MKAVMTRVPDELLAWRKKTGADRWDEVWDGVLHMTPAPSIEHQRILDELVAFLGPLVERTRRGVLRSTVNVCDAPTGWENFRIPDLTFVAAGREQVIAPDGVRFGGPDAVVEIRSPDDETYEKVPFYAKLGVREVIVIDRDTKGIELFSLRGTGYERIAPGIGKALVSEALGVQLLTRMGPPRLLVEDLTDRAVQTEI